MDQSASNQGSQWMDFFSLQISIKNIFKKSGAESGKVQNAALEWLMKATQ